MVKVFCLFHSWYECKHLQDKRYVRQFHVECTTYIPHMPRGRHTTEWEREITYKQGKCCIIITLITLIIPPLVSIMFPFFRYFMSDYVLECVYVMLLTYPSRLSHSHNFCMVLKRIFFGWHVIFGCWNKHLHFLLRLCMNNFRMLYVNLL